MLEITQFIFSSFWVWLGAFLMLAVVASALSGIVNISIRRK